jgi:hypothetical protein
VGLGADRWFHRSAPALSSEDVVETLRLLHARSQYGYTDRPDLALRSEPEAISQEAQDALAARSQRAARDAQLEEWRERRGAVARELQWLYSQRLRRDVRTQLRAVQRQLDRLDRKLTE